MNGDNVYLAYFDSHNEDEDGPDEKIFLGVFQSPTAAWKMIVTYVKDYEKKNKSEGPVIRLNRNELTIFMDGKIVYFFVTQHKIGQRLYINNPLINRSSGKTILVPPPAFVKKSSWMYPKE